MQKIAGLDVEFKVNGKEVSLTLSELKSFLCCIDDKKANTFVFDEFAMSSSHEIREDVSYKNHLSERTVKKLASDMSEEVVANLTRSKSLKKLSKKDIVNMIDRSPRLASYVAYSLDSCKDSLVKEISEYLCSNPDVSVRLDLAKNSSTPKSVLQFLMNDKESDVAEAAAKTYDDK